jgi:hypothetical protein
MPYPDGRAKLATRSVPDSHAPALSWHAARAVTGDDGDLGRVVGKVAA